MYRIAFLLLLTVVCTFPAMAAKRVTVEELEQLLAASQGQSDGKVAKELSDLELTERASSPRLERWETQFPGRHCHEAFIMLGDASAFLDLPADDKPAMAVPNRDAQRAMLFKTVDYVKSAISRLPNFYATRTTEHFEETPAVATAENFNFPSVGRGSRGAAGMAGITPGETQYRPMHNAGKSSVNVGYHDGHEMRGAKRADDESTSRPTSVLTTHGEFGPILSVVLGNAVANKISWGHWEQGVSGAIAVFRYSVPADQSGYMVALPKGLRSEQTFPAYHGEIAVNPADGSVFRITVIADFAPPNDQLRSSILVEYRAVQIGGTPYVCPVKSVAIARIPTSDSHSIAGGLQTQLNDVAFTDYHIFRAEARILTGADVTNDEPPASPK